MWSERRKGGLKLHRRMTLIGVFRVYVGDTRVIRLYHPLFFGLKN